MSDLSLVVPIKLLHTTSNRLTWAAEQCVHAVRGQWGNFWEQNVLYLFWVNAKHFKAFFHAWKRVKSPISPFRHYSPAGLWPVAVVVSCFGPIMWELWAPINPLLSAPTERLLLMTYFGNQKHRPLSTHDKMASDGAWLPQPEVCENWERDNSFWECFQQKRGGCSIRMYLQYVYTRISIFQFLLLKACLKYDAE